ncbi:MAG: ribulose-phosphate 3-epimerase [Patescibacteria group bacterium]|nr:ribulose-phosphate 3-epimerase [Patescibacteria group bacterium]
MKIIPAILENELDVIKNKINFYSSLKQKYSLDFKLIQIDFCDGEFVSNKNWLPENLDNLKELVALEKDFNLEVHLMCKDIRKYFDICKYAGVKYIVVHIDNILTGENEDLLKITEESAETEINLGLCAKLSFMKEKEESILSFVGGNKSKFTKSKLYLQVIGIENIGRQGEPFSKDSVSIIQTVRDLFPNEELEINVDGAVNEVTYKLFENAGASSLVVGSYFAKVEGEEQLLERYNLLKL